MRHTIKKFQNINKVIFVEKLLTQSNLSITEISNLCGYSNTTGSYELLYKHMKTLPGRIKSMSEEKMEKFLIKEDEVHIKILYFMNYDWSYFYHFNLRD